MTERVIRSSRRALPEPEAAPPLRVARRTVINEHPAQRSTTTTTTHRRSTVSESMHDEALASVRFAPGEEPAYVEIGHGKTINTGDYNGVRIDVRVKLPCLPENVNTALDLASELVTERLAQEEIFMLGALAPRRSANRRG